MIFLRGSKAAIHGYTPSVFSFVLFPKPVKMGAE